MRILSPCKKLRITRNTGIVFLLMSVVLYNEWLSYTFAAVNWPVIDADKEHVTVLISADPQILGSDSEPSFPFNYITQWDADRFVSRGFQLALWKVKPDIVIFLGDLLNDGSISSDGDFQQKVEHFKSVLRIPDYVKQTIHVPGDNDIGGEGADYVTQKKVDRFYAAFNQSLIVSHDFVDFVQVQVLDHIGNATNPPSKPLPENKDRIRVLLSHIPLLPMTRPSIKKIIIDNHPSIIFSGHEHDSFHFIGKKKVAKANEFWPLKESNVWALETMSDELHEVTVPTCSYRMGKKSYGYGSLVIEKSGLTYYSVLWLPSRFSQLWLYLVSLLGVLLLILPDVFSWLKCHIFPLCKSCIISLFKSGPKYHRV